MKTMLVLLTVALAFSALAAENVSTNRSGRIRAGSQPGGTLKVAPVIPQVSSLEAVHAEYLKHFIESPGFGASRVPSRFFLQLISSGVTYVVPPPRLVGLEKEPVVYGSFLAKADLTNKQFTTYFRSTNFHRLPLAAWETNLLAVLHSGRDLAVTTNLVETVKDGSRVVSHKLLALGAVRAGRDCVACHHCEQSKLLGAFSYTIVPMEPPDTAKTNAPPSLSSVTRPVGRGSFSQP